jgi:hypothetical protein
VETDLFPFFATITLEFQPARRWHPLVAWFRIPPWRKCYAKRGGQARLHCSELMFPPLRFDSSTAQNLCGWHFVLARQRDTIGIEWKAMTFLRQSRKPFREPPPIVFGVKRVGRHLDLAKGTLQVFLVNRTVTLNADAAANFSYLRSFRFATRDSLCHLLPPEGSFCSSSETFATHHSWRPRTSRR